MLNTSQMILVILICALCSFATRAVPFVIFGNREVPKAVTYIGKLLPMAVITTLLIYCLRNVKITEANSIIPTLAGLFVTVLLHIWRKNTFLSIVCGTALYMVLIHLI